MNLKSLASYLSGLLIVLGCVWLYRAVATCVFDAGTSAVVAAGVLAVAVNGWVPPVKAK